MLYLDDDKDREVHVTAIESKAPSGCLAAMNILREDVENVIPEIHEVHQMYFTDLIACIDTDSPRRAVRIEFMANEMEAERMKNIFTELLVQAYALHEQRMIARSKRNHPTAKRQLIAVPDSSEKPKKKAKHHMHHVVPRWSRKR